MKQLDVMDLMPKDTPEYMAPAWLSCLTWAAGKQEIIDAYRRDSGDKFTPASAPLDKTATGRQEQFVRAFIDWFNESIWGPM